MPINHDLLQEPQRPSRFGIDDATTSWMRRKPAKVKAALEQMDDANEQFQALAKACGFAVSRNEQGLTLHSLRRFFKTFCLDAAVPKPMVDFWMGHRNQKDMDFFYYDPVKSREWMQKGAVRGAQRPGRREAALLAVEVKAAAQTGEADRASHRAPTGAEPKRRTIMSDEFRRFTVISKRGAPSRHY